MDTRSVIRSRRQSARLHKQSRDDKTAKQSLPSRRVSDTAVSRPRSVTPKPAQSQPTTSKAPTIKLAQSTTEPAQASEATFTANSSVKEGKRVANSPIFPNLPATKDTRPDANNKDLSPVTVLSRKPKAAATDDDGTEGRGRICGKWIKTAQGAMRLVQDTPQDVSRGAMGRLEATPVDEASYIPANRRRSARLAGSTPEVEDIKLPATIADSQATQPSTTEREAVAPTTPLKQGPTADSQHPPRRVSSGTSSDSSLTDFEELPPHNSLSLADKQAAEVNLAEKTSPIPELVADIARIIETSSPIAARASHSDKSNIATSTEQLAAETTVTTAPAPESSSIANSLTEAVDNANHNSSFPQPIVADPFPLEFNSEGTSSGQEIPSAFGKVVSLSAAAIPDTFTAIQDQTHGSRGVKRHAEEMSHDEQNPTQQQSLTASNRPLKFVTPTKRPNLIDSAASRDCYDIEDDELGGPDVGLWLDGENGGAGRVSGLQDEPPLHGTIKCGDCGRVPQKFVVCANCLKTGYCGKYCQMWNWPIHRKVCEASKEADSGEVKRQEEYLEGAWAGALQVLKKNVIDRDHDRGTEVQDQAEMQAIVHSSFMDHGVDKSIAEHRSGSVGGDGNEAVTSEEGIGQQVCGSDMGEDETVGVSVMADKHAGNDVQDKEDIVFKMPPPSPESMFRSRAMALRLAQATEV
ncbi:hypothetical protein VMCG_07816 [Cytospora schulzeri]|uniref:MYND-type domain-containing protein n=1 Tax=Cytospora schulzeri TaxID=448051 RepID=A0A423VZQ6_9PEZI|nr:hypothetical protein VMCG_07816 [Valsa malicola]